MREISRLLFVAAVLMTPTALLAEPIDDNTSCATIRAVLDAAVPDGQQIRAISEYVSRTLTTLDHINTAEGGPALIGRMSESGREHTAATVTVRCGDHPEETAQRSAIETYEGLKALNNIIEKGPDP
jgi:hypothetical protein